MKKTEILYLDDKNNEQVAEKVAQSLKNRGICIIPTDTIYGIVALEHFEDSVKRVYEIRERSLNKPLIRLIGDLSSLERYTYQTLPDNLKRYWPGPLTLIFKDKNSDKIAIRFPDDTFLNTLFKKLNYEVIVAPSANKSNEENIYNCDTLIKTFSGKLDIIVCLRYSLKKRKASTIIDISNTEWKIVRQGDIKINF